MRKVLVIGLLLTAVIYLLPVFCGFLEDDAPLPIPQESVAADAEIGESAQPEEAEQTPAGTLAAAQEITVLVDGEVREMDLEEYVVSVVAGGLYLLIIDTLARTVAMPIEIPVGVLTSVVGGPFFLYLMRKSRTEE